MSSVEHRAVYEVRLGELCVGSATLELRSEGGGIAYTHLIEMTVGGVRATRQEQGRATETCELIEEQITARTGDEQRVEHRAIATATGLLGVDGEPMAQRGPWVCSALLSRYGARRGASRGEAVTANLVSTAQAKVVRTVLVPSSDPIPAPASAVAAGRPIVATRHTTDTATITTFALIDGEVLVEEVSNGLRILRRLPSQ